MLRLRRSLKRQAAIACGVSDVCTAAPASGAARSAPPSDRDCRWRRNRPRRQRGLQEKPGFLEGVLDIAAGEILVESGVCCASTCTTACCSFGGRLPDGAAARDWRTAAPGCPAAWPRLCRRNRDGDPLQRRQRIAWRARRPAAGGRGSGRRIAASACTLSAQPRRPGVCALPDHGEPTDAVACLRHRKLQVLARRAAGPPTARRSRDWRSRSAPDCRREPSAPGRRPRCPAAARGRAPRPGRRPAGRSGLTEIGMYGARWAGNASPAS